MFTLQTVVPESSIEQLVSPIGRSVIRYLLKRENGAKLDQVVHKLKQKYRGADIAQLNRKVTSILERAKAMGFLDRKGSRYMRWQFGQSDKRRRRRR